MPRDEAFRHRLQELGYVDGKNIIIEYRFAEGKFDRLRALAEELVRLEVDVIVTAVTQASLAAKHATRTIPIVFAAVSDPLGTGLVASLARPGANVTGTAAMSADVVGKSLELLREAVPAVSRVAVIMVLCPAMTIERLTTEDFIRAPQSPRIKIRHIRNREG